MRLGINGGVAGSALAPTLTAAEDHKSHLCLIELTSDSAAWGLSRSEYVRRRLAQDAASAGSPVSTRDLARFAEVFGDLADPDVMSRAWQ
jgi:hypothetical protein